jgi:hypothetical protein
MQEVILDRAKIRIDSSGARSGSASFYPLFLAPRQLVFVIDALPEIIWPIECDQEVLGLYGNRIFANHGCQVEGKGDSDRSVAVEGVESSM